MDQDDGPDYDDSQERAIRRWAAEYIGTDVSPMVRFEIAVWPTDPQHGKLGACIENSLGGSIDVQALDDQPIDAVVEALARAIEDALQAVVGIVETPPVQLTDLDAIF